MTQAPPRTSSLVTREHDASDIIGPYVLQKLIDDLPLDAGDVRSVRITCVELWGEIETLDDTTDLCCS